MKTLKESLLDGEETLMDSSDASVLNKAAEEKVKKLLANNDALYDQGKFIAANGSGDEALFNYVIALYILYNFDIEYMGTSEIAAKIKELENILSLPKITKSNFSKAKPCLFYDGSNSKPYNTITRSVSNDDLDLHEYGFEWTLETIYECFEKEGFPEINY